MTENPDLFTTRMRKATRKIHSLSDALVNAKFAISLRDEVVWGGGLFVFYHIFSYLEDTSRKLNMQDFNKLFVSKHLYRKQKFEEDLYHYLGENWRSLPKSQALENYLEHLQSLERDNPNLLLAYVYHLYLGLLSGGQILAKKRQLLGEKNQNDTRYKDKVTDFDLINIPQLKREFKNVMNEIAERMSQEEQEAFIEESNQVFMMNNLIVNSISGQDRALYSILYKGSAIVLLCVSIFIAYKMQK